MVEGMNLVIVESPTKARTLARFLGQDYVIEATMGHVRDLPQKKMGIKIDDGKFEPEYVMTKKQEDKVQEIKKLSDGAKSIYLATDPDREGEAIAFHVQEMLKTSSSKSQRPKFERIVFHEITQHAIEGALKSPRAVDMQLVDAQQARRVLDRLVGYKLSPLLWKKVRRGLSAGRVQSVAVRLIVEREREIEKFKPLEYWEIWCEVSSKKAEKFIVRFIGSGDKNVDVKNTREASAIVASLKKSKYQVSDVRQREVR